MFSNCLTDLTDIFPSKGELRRTLKGGGMSINKEKINNPEPKISQSDLIAGKYLIVQKGKKNYYLVVFK
jgi:tyrosyl-tRNA synthetase